MSGVRSMDIQIENEIINEARDLIIRSEFPIKPAELDGLPATDMGMGDIRKEGFVFYEILHTPRLGMTVIF